MKSWNWHLPPLQRSRVWQAPCCYQQHLFAEKCSLYEIYLVDMPNQYAAVTYCMHTCLIWHRSFQGLSNQIQLVTTFNNTYS